HRPRGVSRPRHVREPFAVRRGAVRIRGPVPSPAAHRPMGFRPCPSRPPRSRSDRSHRLLVPDPEANPRSETEVTSLPGATSDLVTGSAPAAGFELVLPAVAVVSASAGRAEPVTAADLMAGAALTMGIA